MLRVLSCKRVSMAYMENTHELLSYKRALMANLGNPHVIPKFITYLSSLLQRVVESNDSNRWFEPQTISAFHGLTTPTISIKSYLERIFQYADCSPSCFIVAYIYLDRFVQCQPSLRINSFSVHRLIITSVMVAAKFMDDINYKNEHYAKVGGISTMELNFLEVDFLFGLSFHLNVTPTTFHTYLCHLHGEMLLESPLNVISLRSLKLPCYFSEDESAPQKQQQLTI